MMKQFKLMFLVLTIIVTYLIYTFASGKKISYLALGDSFALGENPYGEVDYGYSDYLADYFEKNNELKLYTKKFATEDARIKDVQQEILFNKKIYIDGKSFGLKNALRESTYITLSIGARDIINQVEEHNVSMNEEKIEKITRGVGEELKNLIKEIKKYNHNIFLVGYYNLYPEKDIYNQIFKQLDQIYKKVSLQEEIQYISLYEDFPYQKYLPNPYSVHPSTAGYEYIYKKIIQNIKN